MEIKTEPTRLGYEKALAGAEIMLEYAEGKQKEDLLKSIEGFKIKIESMLDRGGLIQSKKADKNRRALPPGERTSAKTSQLNINGKNYRRRNANQFGKAEGGNDYTEIRKNRTDKNLKTKLKQGGEPMAKKTMPKALNKWRDHLAEVRKANPSLKLSEAMKLAAKSYKK